MSNRITVAKAIQTLRDKQYIVERHKKKQYIVRYPKENPLRSQPVNVKQLPENAQGYTVYSARQLIKHARIYMVSEYGSKTKQLYKYICKRKSRAISKRKIVNEQFDDLDKKQDAYITSSHYYF